MTTSPHGPMLLIANPRSGTGRGGALDTATTTLARLGVDHEVRITSRRVHATELARRAVTEEAVRFVVAVGGDGTVHEVVNGLVDAATGTPLADDLVLGVVPGGSGSDFVRTWGLDIAVDRLVERHLVTSAVMPLDLGRVTHLAPDGSERRTVFANIAQCGWGAEVVHRAARLPRFVGRPRYLLATVASTVRVDEVQATVTLDHTTMAEPVTEVLVANGQFFGSGLKIAPRALPDDGRFNVQTWRGGARVVLENLPRARHGEHLSSPHVREWQSTTVAVDGERPMAVEADGEVLGTTPARFDVLHRVLRLSV